MSPVSHETPSVFKKCCLGILATWLVTTALLLKTTMTVSDIRETSFSTCSRVQIPSSMNLHSTEGTISYKRGIVFISAGCLSESFFGDVNNQTPGAVLAVDTTQHSDKLKLIKLNIVGFPENVRFQPHGLYFSDKSQRLYTVNHAMREYGSRVEIFEIIDDDASISVENKTMPWLRYIGGIASDMFKAGGLNSVVEGRNDNEVYITQWKKFSLPSNGIRGVKSYWTDYVSSFLRWMEDLVPLPITPVFHCSFNTVSKLTDAYTIPSTCKMSTEKYFYGANGIAINDARDTLFVSSPIGRQLASFMINSTNGRLMFKAEIQSSWAIDNIHWDKDTSSLVGGGIPDVFSAFQHMMHGGEVYGSEHLVDGGCIFVKSSQDSKLHNPESAFRMKGGHGNDAINQVLGHLICV